MKITAIRQQQKQANRYSIFVDEKYAFSLSEQALLDSKLASGQELTPEQVADYKQLSADDKLYNRALRYVALRQRSTWEVQDYLRRKDAPAPLIEQITNRLTDLQLLDDRKFAEVWIRDRQVLRPASRRKIFLELRRKHISEELIGQALAVTENDETSALQAVIDKKRRQTKYQDDTKLMQYLARQGFGYDDIKRALSQ